MARRRVTVFRKDILPVSETFIPAQVEACRHWVPTLMGFQRVPGLDPRQLDQVILYDAVRLSERVALKRDQFLPYANVPGRRVLTALKRTRPELVHAHFGYDAVLVADATRRLGVPLVVTLHGTDVLRDWRAWASGRDGFFFRFYPAKIKRLFADPNVHFIAVSEVLREAAIRNGAPEERTRVIYTGIRPERFFRIERHPPRQPSVLFIGRLVEFKGCEYLVRALAEAKTRVPNVRLIVAGDGPLRAKLEALASTLNVDAEFLGSVAPAQIERLMGQTSIFCLPSITDRDGGFEAFGMVMLEAQAAGVPLITSAAAGREAVIQGETGFVVPPANIPALAAVLADLLEAPTERLAAMGDAGRIHIARQFDVATCVQELEGYYDDIVGAGHR